jgi:hypothetical protein
VYIPEGDRRYNVGNYQPEKLERPDDNIVSKELAEFAQWLLAHEASLKKANEIIHTEARDRISRMSVTSIAETCRAIREGDFDMLWLARPDEHLMLSTPIIDEHTRNSQAYCMLMRELAKAALINPKQILTRDELQIILQYNVGGMPRTPNKFTSLLRHNGIETRQCRRGDLKTFGIDVKWNISDELREELMGGKKATVTKLQQPVRKVAK